MGKEHSVPRTIESEFDYVFELKRTKNFNLNQLAEITLEKNGHLYLKILSYNNFKPIATLSQSSSKQKYIDI